MMGAQHHNPAHNLPISLTSFIGREREKADIARFLTMHTRLVTITGVGGCGKTRLALETAWKLADVSEPLNLIYPDGIWFVDLAPLTNPALIPQKIAFSLKLRESPGRAPSEIVLGALRTRKALLILDNCEHLVEACAQLVETLLRACPNIAILVTSRSPLNLMGETIYPLPPMDILNPDDQLPLTNLVRSESVHLFIDRARAMQPNFELTEENARAVIQICQRLDGIPLAIELVAIRIKTLAPEQILRRLGDVFSLLRSSSPATLPRHQSLQAVFDWSYALLNRKEQLLFHRLSCFAGGWTLGAAEVVTVDKYLPSGDVLNLHERLLDQSLITRMDTGQDERARYRLLEPVRQYALEFMAESDESKSLRARHLDYFTNLAENAWKGFLSPEYPSWFQRIAADIDNIRTALDWSMNGGRIELGLRTAVALFQFWTYSAGLLSESIEIYRELLVRTKVTDFPLEYSRALAFLSLSYLRQSDHQQAITVANEALVMADELPDTRVKAYALAGLGHAHGIQGNFAEGQAYLELSLALFQTAKDIPGQGWTLSRLGVVALYAEEYEKAGFWLADMAHLMQASGNELYLGYALRHWGFALLYQGDIVGALEKFRKNLSLSVGFPGENCAPLASFAAVAIKGRQYERAARLLGAVEAMVDQYNAILLPYDLDEYNRNSNALDLYLEESTLEAAWSAGRGLTTDQAVTEALELSEDLKISLRSLQTYPAGLTQREVEVLRLVAQGLTNQKIADRLVISPRTVHAHLRSIFDKLEVTTRMAAARQAERLKLV